MKLIGSAVAKYLIACYNRQDRKWREDREWRKEGRGEPWLKDQKILEMMELDSRKGRYCCLLDCGCLMPRNLPMLQADSEN